MRNKDLEIIIHGVCMMLLFGIILMIVICPNVFIK
jgi:hypothetical protein